MKKILLYALVLASIVPAFAQTTLTLTFNGRDQNNARVQLDNVVIMNVTRGWTEATFFPDTVYTLTVGTGVADYLLHGGMQVMPNPFEGRTQVNIYSAKTESVTMTLMDINGKRCAEYNGLLSDGNNYFEIELVTPQTYILSVRTTEGTRSLKMVNTGSAGRNQIKGTGVSSNSVQLKSAKGHTFELGDEMRYTGYSQQSNGLIPSTPITQNQYESETITLHFTLENDAELPLLATVAASNIGMNTATTGGNIFSDGGAPITARGVCYSVTPNPTLSENHTSDGTGTGAFTSSLTNLVENTTYYVRAYATNSAGTAYGNEISFTTEAGSSLGNACPGTPTVTDYDGNIYNTVQIGTQCWMKENLRTTHYANGDPIAEGITYSSKVPYRYTPDGNAANVTAYGYLYNWPAVMHGDSSSNTNPSGTQGICPAGWHVPSAAEWDQLATYVNSQSEFLCGGYNNYIAKALASNIGWNYHSVSNACAVCNNLTLNNATGFSAMPAGQSYGSYHYGFGNMAAFSTSTLEYDDEVEIRGFCYDDPDLTQWLCDADGELEEGLSVRCVKGDGTSAQLPKVVTTATVTNITSTSVTCGGNVTNSGSMPVTARGICYGTSPNPTIADNHTNDGTGPGAFTSNLTGLTSGTLYYLRAYATNSLGTTYGENTVFITYNPNDGQPCTSTPTLTDYDGNIYNTVQIGIQCWMKENLRTTHFANGDECNLYSSSSSYYQTPWRYAPNDNPNNVATYGYLYNRIAMLHGSAESNSIPSGVLGICPTGWHVPSLAEFQLLTGYLGTRDIFVCDNNSQNIAKALADPTGWNSSDYSCSIGHNPSQNNTSGFSARPAGNVSGNFGHKAFFWTTTFCTTSSSDDYEPDGINYLGLYYNSGGISTSNSYLLWNDAFSVRCVRDETSASTVPPTVTTNSVVVNSSVSASFTGTVTANGGATVTEYGVCWSISPNPTIADNHIALGNGLGTFTGTFGPLTPNTMYYVKAYATNSAGTGYGEEMTFTHNPAISNGVTVTFNGTTWEASFINGIWYSDYGAWEVYASQIEGQFPKADMATSITSGTSSATANSNGSISENGNFHWVEYYDQTSLQDGDGTIYGDYWAKNVSCTVSSFDPTTLTLTANVNATMFSAYDAFINGTGIDAASTAPMTVDIVNVSLTGNGSGTTTAPTVTTDSVSSVSNGLASFSGTVTSSGGAPVTEYGVCWGTSPNPTIADNHTALGSGQGSFTGTFGPLTPNTLYYVRAYATNSAGTGYGGTLTFTLNSTFNNGVTVTFNDTTWQAGSIQSRWYDQYNAWQVYASQSEEQLPIVDIATSIVSGTNSASASESGSLGNNFYWVEYYHDNYLLDGDGNYYGDYWAKDVTCTVTSFDATALTLTANVNATMFSALEAFINGTGVNAAPTATMTVDIVNVSLTNNRSSGMVSKPGLPALR